MHNVLSAHQGSYWRPESCQKSTGLPCVALSAGGLAFRFQKYSPASTHLWGRLKNARYVTYRVYQARCEQDLDNPGGC